MTSPPAVRKPRQARSEASLERMLAAAEELLERGTLESMKIGELVALAGTSVGAFYARFSDKSALLELVQERFYERAIASFDVTESPTLDETVRRQIDRAIELYRRRPGLLSSLSLLARLQPDSRLAIRAAEVNAQIYEQATRQILRHRDEIQHPRPKVAVRFGLTMVVSTLREHLLFGRGALGASKVSDATLGREMTRAFISYLGSDHQPTT